MDCRSWVPGTKDQEYAEIVRLFCHRRGHRLSPVGGCCCLETGFGRRSPSMAENVRGRVGMGEAWGGDDGMQAGLSWVEAGLGDKLTGEALGGKPPALLLRA